MNYEEAIFYIKNTSKFSVKNGLERIEKILEILGSPHKKLRCIHVAGTNGKGSTTAMISRILMENGFKVGMFISPYLEVFEERIEINGENIKKEDLSLIISKVKNAVETANSLGYDNPTEFEIITCAMFLYFYEKKVEFAVIEVGLGGRLDSTNVITPILSVITSISLDHMKILGDTLGKIASEKAGIIKENVPVVVYPEEKEAYEVIKNKAATLNSKVIDVPVDSARFYYNNNFYQHVLISGKNKYETDLKLLGEHQLLNAATAVYAAEALIDMKVSIKKEAIIRGLHNVIWPGRLEVLRKDPVTVLDGAHNRDGIKKLAISIKKYFKYDKLILVLGILADKEVTEMVKTIVPLAEKVITVTPHNIRGECGTSLLSEVKKINENSIYIEDYEKAYKEALKSCNKKSLLVICGSLYMIGDMRKIIRKDEAIV